MDVQYGKILIGGDFTLYDDVERGRITRLNADGSIDKEFVPLGGFDLYVRTIATHPDKGFLLEVNLQPLILKVMVI